MAEQTRDTAGTRRRRVPDSLDWRLRSYYGEKRCVASADAAGEWHHLDDRPDRTYFANMVPLQGGLNVALGAAKTHVTKNAAHVVVPAAVEPGNLLALARLHRAAWSTGRAFGATRLASYVARSYLRQPNEQVLGYVAESLRHLRHQFDSDLLDDVLRRDVLPLASQGAAAGSASSLKVVYQLAVVYADFGYVREAAAIYDRIDPQLQENRIDGGWYTNAVRRRATVRALTGRRPAETIAVLDDLARRAQGDLDLALAVDFTTAWQLARKDDKRNLVAARDRLEPYVTQVKRPLWRHWRTGVWHVDPDRLSQVSGNNAAHFLATLDLLRRKTDGYRRSRRRNDEAAQASAVFERLGSKLEGDTGLRWESELGDYSPALMPARLPATTLCLLDDAVRALLAA